MGNDPINGVDPDGAWVKGAGFFKNVFNSDAKIHAQNYASASSDLASSMYKDVSAMKVDGQWGVFTSDRPFGGSEGFMSFTAVNNDGSLGATSGDFFYTGLASGSAGTSLFDHLGTFLYTSAATAGVGAGVGLTARGLSVLGQRLLFGGANRVFWSGGGMAVAGSEATAFAMANGATTLEMTLAGRALTTLQSVTSASFTKPLWNLASKGFASGARGTSQVFVAPELLSNTSVWLNTERAILRSNQVHYNYIFIF